jgi:EmrB/QacA subfamily drug resistance transporter
MRSAPSHRYVVLAIVLVGVFMSVLDSIVVSIALPTITTSFAVDVALSQWTITAYMLTMTSLLLFFGRVSERTGRTVLFIAGFAVFTLGSLACGLSATFGQLVGFRVLQAVGGSMVFSISGAILFQAFPPDERGRAMGYLGSTVAVASVLGPIVGGILVDSLGWRSIFLVNVPIGVVLVPGALAFLRVPEKRTARLEMDWAGAAALAVCLVSLMLALSLVAQPAIPLVPALAAAAVFLAAGSGFLVRELRCRRPLLDPRLFRNSAFTRPLAAMTLYFAGSFMMNIAGPFYFEGAMGFSPTRVGLVYLIVPLAMAVASPVSGWLFDRRPWPWYGVVGIAVAAAAFIALGVIARQYSLAWMAVLFAVLGLGSALFQSPNNTEIMSALPASELSVASSVSSAARNLGMTLGVALASVLLALQLRLAGWAGPVLQAEKGTLAGAVGGVLVVSGILCAASALVLVLVGRTRRPA